MGGDKMVFKMCRNGEESPPVSRLSGHDCVCWRDLVAVPREVHKHSRVGHDSSPRNGLTARASINLHCLSSISLSVYLTTLANGGDQYGASSIWQSVFGGDRDTEGGP